MTGDGGVVAFIFVDGLSTVGHWLDFDLIFSCFILLTWKSVLLAGLALETGLAQFCTADFTSQAVLLNGLVTEVGLT